MTMTILMTMVAFAGIYALIAAMVGDNWPALADALAGGRRGADQLAVSRSLKRA